MTTNQLRDLRFLKMYAFASTLLWFAVVAMALAPDGDRPKFEEIDVERINIVEADGQLRMVISNKARQHPGQVDGKLIPREHARPPGMLFFNHRGDECGGLIFDENGGKGHFVSMTMDKSRHDQTIGMQHLESDNGAYWVGLRVWDRPNDSLHDMNERYEAAAAIEDEEARNEAFREMRENGDFGFQRLTFAKQRDTSAVISLADQQGRTRVRIMVDPEGNPKMEFLDASGEVTYALPESAN